MSLQALRQQRGVVAIALQALVAKPEFTADDQAAYDKGIDDLNKIDASMKRINDVNEALARDTADLQAGDALERFARDHKGAKSAAAHAHAKWLKGGDAALNTDDWTAIRNTMSTTTGSEGGFTVPVEVATSVVEALKAYGGIRRVADVISTSDGASMSFPTSDGTAEEGEIIGENATATDLDVTFGTVPLATYKFSSKVVTVPWELLQDAAVDIEAFVNARINTRLGRITNKMFTIGTGTAQPFGLQVAAPIGVTAANATSQVTAVTYDSLVNTQHSVDPAYRERGTCGWMFNDNTMRDLRKIKDSSNRPIFVPGYEAGNPGGEPDRLLGAPITINQHMPDMAASVKSILYGDFKGYIVRDVMATTLFRFTDSAYSKKGQVGFLAWMRSGGNLIDAGAVRAFRNAAS
jgi:HK97 family phage major capsid protein